jgi:DNA-binding IclR family transcriptional regulator
MQNNKYAVPAVDKCLDVLEYLAVQPLPKTQAEIAQGLNRTANEIYRVLVGLEMRGYLSREQDSGRYRVSLKLYNLSRSISPIDQMRQSALPHMEDLAVKLGLSCQLFMLYQSQTMVIVHANSPSPVSLHVTEGSIFPTVELSAGRVLLANSNTEVRNMILQRSKTYVSKTALEKKAFNILLQDIQQKGYYATNSELTPGVFDTSALIGEPEGKVVAALTVSSLNLELNSDNKMLIKSSLLHCAENIKRQLGC